MNDKKSENAWKTKGWCRVTGGSWGGGVTGEVTGEMWGEKGIKRGLKTVKQEENA